ncbi:MAG: hypothetical protein RR088_04265 [Clostridia bacterium]
MVNYYGEIENGTLGNTTELEEAKTGWKCEGFDRIYKTQKGALKKAEGNAKKVYMIKYF